MMKLRGLPPDGVPALSYVGQPNGTVIGGIPGPTGPVGPAGPQGIQGPVGPQGIQGPVGPQGQGLHIDQTVADYASLPTGLGSADAGRSVFVEADNLIYVWDGSSWPSDGSGATIVGPQGPQGIQGPLGPIGPEGPQGVQGLQGPQGTAGVSLDIQGTVATYGDLPGTAVNGDAYVVAADGLLYFHDGTGFPANGAGVPFQGPQGAQGIQGPQGIQGIQGVQGDTGPQGPKGDTGPAGTTDWSGITGKPAVIAAGADAAAARAAVGAGNVTGSNNGTVTALTLWTGTSAQYAAIGVKDPNTVYVVTA